MPQGSQSPQVLEKYFFSIGAATGCQVSFWGVLIAAQVCNDLIPDSAPARQGGLASASGWTSPQSIPEEEMQLLLHPHVIQVAKKHSSGSKPLGSHSVTDWEAQTSEEMLPSATGRCGMLS
jgi:hypothetical protein